MKELLPVGCVIMASGQASRFGSNKLLAPFLRGTDAMPRICGDRYSKGFRPAS